MKLIIANKVHSSWSLRAWILLRHFDIPFEEILIPFGPIIGDPAWKAELAKYTPGGHVPAIADGDIVVWESLAIMEYIAEKFPDRAIWPRDPAARAMARSIASEMHAGFSALRSACPCNLGRRHPPKDRGPKVAANVARIREIWNEARSRFGKPTGKPYLFGEFSAADAMYAPVATRFHSYSIAVDPVSQAYVDAIYGNAAFKEWRAAALQEKWIVSEDEADEPTLENYRPHLQKT